MRSLGSRGVREQLIDGKGTSVSRFDRANPIHHNGLERHALKLRIGCVNRADAPVIANTGLMARTSSIYHSEVVDSDVSLGSLERRPVRSNAITPNQFTGVT